MTYIFLGFIGFLFFILYDINSIILKQKFLNSCFFIGFFWIVLATAGIVISSVDSIQINATRMGIYGIFTVLFLILLIYTLFFALPFKHTYIELESSPKVCQNGVYALCRHPGVLWFTGFYLFFGLTLQIPLLFTAAVIFSSLNILYVIFQDKWTFVKTFINYDEYKKDTPFLIPNIKSIRHCLRTL